jgi:hypothetical protein
VILVEPKLLSKYLFIITQMLSVARESDNEQDLKVFLRVIRIRFNTKTASKLPHQISEVQ